MLLISSCRIPLGILVLLCESTRCPMSPCPKSGHPAAPTEIKDPTKTRRPSCGIQNLPIPYSIRGFSTKMFILLIFTVARWFVWGTSGEGGPYFSFPFYLYQAGAEDDGKFQRHRGTALIYGAGIGISSISPLCGNIAEWGLGGLSLHVHSGGGLALGSRLGRWCGHLCIGKGSYIGSQSRSENEHKSWGNI